MKENKEKQRGITLIALVITIIVLLILASVTIQTIMSSDSAPEKAVQAKESTSKAAIIEKVQLIITDSLLDKGKTDFNDIKTKLQNAQGYSSLREEDNKIIVTIDGYDISIDQNKNVAVVGEESNGSGSGGGNGNENNTSLQVVATQDKILNKQAHESGKTEQLTHTTELENGGTWKSANPSIATVDNTGLVTWNSVGKTKITYETTDEKAEEFNYTCTLTITPAHVEDWQSVSDLGQNGVSEVYGNLSYCSAGILSANYMGAVARDNKWTYHVTMYKTLDLTNVKTISFVGRMWGDHNTAEVEAAYKSGLVAVGNEVTAECTYDSNFCTTINFGPSHKEENVNITYDVSSITGNRILAFTATHPNVQGYTMCAGYYGDIVLAP